MATKRSARGKKQIVVYKEQSSSDSEEENDPKIKKAKMKLKELVNEDDSGSDFESELKKEKKKNSYQSSDDEEEEVMEEGKAVEKVDIKRKNQSKSNLRSKTGKVSTSKIISKPKINQTKIGHSKFNEIFRKPQGKISTEKLLSKSDLISSSKNVNLFENVKIPLNNVGPLSESDSSDDESVVKRQVTKPINKTPTKSLNTAQMRNDAFDAQDDMVANDKLLALAGNLDKINNAWKEDKGQEKQTKEETPSGSKKKRPSKSSDKPEISNDDFDISKILAQGEGVGDNNPLSDDDDDNTNEALKSPVKSQKSIEINIALPENRKRKKKGFDLAAYLKRELSKGRRELQVVLHQCHYLCLLSHLRYVSVWLQDPVLQSVALSLVPSAHSHSPANLTLPRLQGLVAWLRDALPMTKDNVGALQVPLKDSLLKKLEHFVVSNEVEMVLVFVLICRALGYDTRLVLNFAVVSIKPPTVSEDGEGQAETKKKETKDEGKNKKKKSSRTCSDDEGEEYPEEKTKTKSSSKKLAAAAEKRASSVNHKSRGKGNAEQREADLLKSLEKKHKGESREQFNQKTIDKLTKKKAKDGNKAEETSKKPSKTKSKEMKPGLDYWCEVFVGKWVTVDIVNGKSNCSAEMEAKATRPVTYVLADNGVGVKDVTRRYAANYMTQTRKIRCTQEWLDGALCGLAMPNDAKNEKEDKDLDRNLQKAPMPTTVSAFKDHPLYALERHLLKFEAIYPPNSVTLGFMKSEPVYARECVHTLNGRTAWLKEGRTVKLKEEPYKVVKARPKWDRMTGNVTKDEPLELFGKWQTELYVPPPAENGKVPRNEYGNVELFKPWMLPIGCVHLPINTLRGTAKRLNIDAAPAMVGWDFSGGGSHPVYDGYVVVEERAEELMDAWNKDQADKEQRQKEKKEARVLGNWRRMIKGLMTIKRIQAKYMDKSQG